jgi:di/tricarboxylate transporter
VTPDILIVIAVLVGAIVLFVTERMRVDVVALLVLLSLALLGVITHRQALQGFSNEAVVTIASVLVLSGGLMRTGVANILGQHVLRLAGHQETRLLAVMMLAVGLMSGIINNIAVGALMLPAVLDIARRTDRPPSMFLMPLAFGSLLGGLTTLIGTSPNILISGALVDSGLRPFSFFDFTPVGLIALVMGTAYMVIVGRRLLPVRDRTRQASRRGAKELDQAYQLPSVLFTLTLPPGSALAGKTLGDVRFRPALGITVMAILRAGKTILAPGARTKLRADDRLVVQGTPGRLSALRSWRQLRLEEDWHVEQDLVTALKFADLTVADGSKLIGRTLEEVDFRGLTGVLVVAITRDGRFRRTRLRRFTLQSGDRLLVVGVPERVEALIGSDDFTNPRTLTADEVARIYALRRRFLAIRVPQESRLAGMSLTETRLRDAFGLSIVGILRESETRLLPEPIETLQAGDLCLVEGRQSDFENLEAMQQLEIDEQGSPTIDTLESDDVGLAEVVLAPRTRLSGKTLREIDFHEKYGLTVVEIWREAQSFTTKLRNMALKFGDALLVYGPREKLNLLAKEPDFLVLTEVERDPLREDKAAVAAVIMAAVVTSVVVGLLPIYIAALAGATAMVVTGCLTAGEAYSSVEWKAVVLIAGMLSLGVAMQQSGAAQMIASSVLGSVATFGPRALIAGLFVITALAAQVMPTAVVAVLMSQIALSSAGDLGLSPHALLMVVAVGSSAAFMSPVGHPVNLLVMGVGGYRFTDYTKVGLPLVVLLLLIVVFILPLIWPLNG